MHVDFGFICDYADATTKLSAIGIGFDTIYAPRVPCVHPIFHLVVQLSTSGAEAGRKEVNIHLTDADGKDIVPPVPMNMEIPQPPPGMMDTHGRLVVGFAGIQFPDYGQYEVRVSVQGNEMVRIPLRIAQSPTTT